MTSKFQVRELLSIVDERWINEGRLGISHEQGIHVTMLFNITDPVETQG